MKTREIAKQGIVAAIYMAVSLLIAPLAFGQIQFRIPEAMMTLPFYRKEYIFGLTLGCLLTNLFSPMGVVDVVFGTVATLLTCLIVSKIKKKRWIPFVAAAINGLIIGLELYFMMGLPFGLSFGSVAVGEFGVVLIGALLSSIVEKGGVFSKMTH